MKRLLAICALALLPQAAAAQEDDEGRIARWIESALSSGATRVDLQGFRGALSSEASLDRLTVADEDGIWLTVEGARLDWNRAAILRGRININALTAERVVLDRLPVSEDGGPAPEARPFALPELPVSIDIRTADIDRVEIGTAVFGQAVALSAEAAVTLSGGAGQAELSVERIDDGGTGQVTLAAAYDNATTEASVDLVATEGPGGIAVTLLNIEGAPPVGLTMTGQGPIDDFAAEFALATDGQYRLEGTATSGTTEAGETVYALDIAGDLTPVLSGDAETFVGTDARLTARAVRHAGGAVTLEDLDLRAAAMSLSGTLALDPDYRPEAFALTGSLAPPAGDRLALPGGGAEIAGAEIDLHYDRAAGDNVDGVAVMTALSAGGFEIDRAALAIDGAIGRSRAGAITGFAGGVALRARGLNHTDGDIAAALGSDLSLDTLAVWQPGDGLSLSDLVLETEGARLTGTLSADPGTERLDVIVDVALSAEDIAPFGGLVGQDLGGAADLELTLTGEALSGAFDAGLRAVTENLRLGDAVPAGLLAGTTTLNGGISRDATGVTLHALTLHGRALSLEADGRLATDTAALDVSAALTDAALADPRLSGPVHFTGRVGRTAEDAPFTFQGLRLATDYGTIAGDATLLPGEERVDLTAEITAALTNIAGLSAIAGRELDGTAGLSLTGSAELRTLTFDAEIEGQTRDIRVAGTFPEGLLPGVTRISGAAARDLDGFTFRDLTIDGEALDAELDGRLGTDSADLDLSARLSDLAVFEPRLPGPVAVSGQVRRDGPDMPYRILGLSARSGFATLSGDLSVLPSDDALALSADVTGAVDDLSRLSTIAGMDLGGSAELSLDGSATIPADAARMAEEGAADITFAMTARDLAAGAALPPQLLAGATVLSGRTILSDGTIRFEQVALDGQEITARLDGSLGPETSAATLTARLRDAGLFTPVLPGAVALTAEVSRDTGAPFTLDAEATGPGGLTLDAAGTVGAEDLSLDLDVTGQAPLPLVNRFIAPRSLTGMASFDLDVTGRPALDAVSGQVSIAGARLTAPTFGISIDDISAQANLAGGSATLDLDAGIGTGGRISASGNIGYGQPGLPANLSLSIDRGRFVDPTLYDATVERARLSLTGALLGNSLLAGDILLGTVEVRVPESGIGGAGAIPDILHTGETAAERRTRAYAGLLGTDSGASAGSSRIGLDIGITAPGRIFVRGRGLDAELGGALRIGGTIANIVPSGQFELIRGRLSILGQRLDLVEGSATLQGDLMPVVDLTAQTRAGDYTILIGVSGPATAPEVSFGSTPDLPEDEVLAQLFFGRSASSLSPLQALQLADAVAELAGGGSGIFTRLREGLGLDDLDVETDDQGNAAVRAGRYLSENVYTDVIVDNEGTGVTLNIDLTPSVTARGGVSSAGEGTLGIFFERDY